ncbi:MAG: sodium/proton-translocating pyrophosphatase, partial [Flavobacteriaceae bacterium]|nr:sodium/proton-translocating pyrophosphatase [Flavobacteriaceae bacterium]
EGTGTPEYAKCVDISTKAALKEMILPGLITIITPIVVGLLFGAEPLGGYMAGVCVSGVMWAIFQNNAGGAWDNAKKSFEAGVEIEGEMTYKGSDAHKAAVTGDTVGDPFKDTSGPSMNILIKLTCLVGLVIAPILGEMAGNGHGHADATEEIEITLYADHQGADHDGHKEVKKEVKVKMEANEDGTAKAIMTITTTDNGDKMIEEKIIEGASVEEVKEKVEKITKGLK